MAVAREEPCHAASDVASPCVVAAGAAKPTALFIVALPVGALMLWRTPPRRWLPVFAATAAAGLLVLAPYFARNSIAGGNPVFPYLTSFFGDAHWTDLEVARWHLGHHEAAPLAERLRHLVTRRGLGHEQWSIIPAAGAILLLFLVRSPLTRRAAATLAGCAGVQATAWLFTGHVQSRFLLPIAVALTEEGTRRGFEVWAATEGFRSLGPDATQELRFERLVVSRRERYELLADRRVGFDLEPSRVRLAEGRAIDWHLDARRPQERRAAMRRLCPRPISSRGPRSPRPRPRRGSGARGSRGVLFACRYFAVEASSVRNNSTLASPA